MLQILLQIYDAEKLPYLYKYSSTMLFTEMLFKIEIKPKTTCMFHQQGSQINQSITE